MEKSLSIRFYLGKYNDKTDKFKLYLRIIYNRQKKEVALSHFVSNDDWNEDKQRTHRNRRLNEELTHKENRIFEIKRDLEFKGIKITAQLIKDAFIGKSDRKEWLLIDYFSHFIESIRNSPNHSKGSIEFYEKSLLHLTSYAETANLKSVLVTEIDRPFITGLDTYLINHVSRFTKKKICRNYVNGLHEKLKAVLNFAVNERVIIINPYRGFTLKDEETTRTYLTLEELQTIETHSLGRNPSLINVRNIFIFSVYTGLRYSDAMSLKINNFFTSGNRVWVKFKQEKTDTEVEVPLIKQALSLYNEWKGSESCKITGFILPRITNQKLNTYLKVVAELCGISKDVTHHVARHTFATVICLDNEIPLEVTSKLLGHKNLKTTQIYGKITRKRLSNVADTLDKALKQKDLKVSKK